MRFHPRLRVIVVVVLVCFAAPVVAQEHPDSVLIQTRQVDAELVVDNDALDLLIRRLDGMEKDDPKRPEIMLKIATSLEDRARKHQTRAWELEDQLYRNPDVTPEERRARLEPIRTLASAMANDALHIRMDFERDYPEHERADENLFALALAEQEAGRPASDFWKRIIARFPDSPFIDDAYLNLAEAAFMEARLDEAVALYERVIELGDAPIRDYARYKLAWTRYNLGEPARALQVLTVMIKTPDLKDAMRREVLKDMARFYAEAPTKPEKARAFFEAYTREPAELDTVLERLERIYRDVGRNAAAEIVAEQR